MAGARLHRSTDRILRYAPGEEVSYKCMYRGFMWYYFDISFNYEPAAAMPLVGCRDAVATAYATHTALKAFATADHARVVRTDSTVRASAAIRDTVQARTSCWPHPDHVVPANLLSKSTRSSEHEVLPIKNDRNRWRT